MSSSPSFSSEAQAEFLLWDVPAIHKYLTNQMQKADFDQKEFCWAVCHQYNIHHCWCSGLCFEYIGPRSDACPPWLPSAFTCCQQSTSHRKFPLSFNQIFAEALKLVRNKAPPGTQTGRIIEKLMHVASNSSHVFAPVSPNFALLSQRKVTLSSQAEKRFCSWAHLQGLEGKQTQEN